MYQKVSQCFEAHALGFRIEQPSLNQAANSGVHFRSAHAQGVSQIRIAGGGGT